MAQKLDPKETVSFKELLMSNMIEIQEIVTLLFEKGIINQDEYLPQLKRFKRNIKARKDLLRLIEMMM